MESTTSVPKDGENGSKEKDDNLGVGKNISNKITKLNHKESKNNIQEEYVFDSPSNQLYFQNFVMFLEELIKTEYPEKAKLYEESANEFELTIEEKDSQNF